MKKNIVTSFPRYTAFRDAVDVAGKQHESESDHYATPTEAFDAIVRSFENVSKDGDSSSRPMNGQICDELGQLAKEITLASMLDGAPLEPLFSIAHMLRDALYRAGAIPVVSSDSPPWIQAIRIALAHNQRRDGTTAANHQPQPRHITFAHAVRYFRERRIDLPLVGDGIGLRPSEACTLAASVSQPLLSLGDTRVMQLIDTMLTARFDPIVERVRLHPTPDLMGRKMDRSFPCGYLYRIALKSLGRKRTTTRPRSALSEIEIATKHLAALYDVEPFLVYETMFPPYPERILEALTRVAIYDELFAIPQCQSDVMGPLLEKVIDAALDHQACEALEWKANDAMQLWRLLIELVPRSATTTFVQRALLKSMLSRRVGPRACDALLRTFVLSTPNSAYRLPANAHDSNSRECAMAEASGDRFWIAPRPFLGPAFYARVLNTCTKIDEHASSRVGKAFEEHLFRRMTALGIPCRRGDLGTKGAKTGDVDLIIETKEVICLFELKKKELTGKTNAGNDLQLAIDLARGLVHGVNQLAKHEITLTKEKKLTFVDGSSIALDGRQVIKGVISLTDYGGLHDGAILRNMLRCLRGSTLSSKVTLSADQEASVSKANSILKTLGDRSNEFETVKGEDSNRDLFDNLLFHNVFFIEHLLRTHRSGEALLSALVRGTRIVTGSRDPFFDFAQFNP